MKVFSRRGLTLIEVMIAILVFAIGALGLAATSAAIVRQMAASAKRSRAAHLAASLDEKTHAVATER
jgi:prepilin-type N-terminal cleavage/methylation domain-containing protein